MDNHFFVLWRQSYAGPSTGTIMDKPKRGRPRQNPAKVSQFTRPKKLAETVKIEAKMTPPERDKLKLFCRSQNSTVSAEIRKWIATLPAPD